MTLTIVPRAAIGCPEPPATRPKMKLGTDQLLVHYTGSPGYDDPAKDLLYARSVAKFGQAAGKTWEYHYLIGLGGTVFEQAGEYVAAHCKSYNPQSYGVLMMLGVGVAPTIIQITSFHELRAHLVGTGQLHENHVLSPHYRFRATACPGSTLAETPHGSWPSPTGEGSRGELIPALRIDWRPPPPIEVAPTPPTSPTIPTTEDLMLALDWQPGTGNWTVFGFNATHLAWAKSGTNQVFNAGGVPRVTINAAQLLDIINSSVQTTLPPPTLTPAMLAAWG